jgi:hypothetical protein
MILQLHYIDFNEKKYPLGDKVFAPNKLCPNVAFYILTNGISSQNLWRLKNQLIKKKQRVLSTNKLYSVIVASINQPILV